MIDRPNDSGLGLAVVTGAAGFIGSAVIRALVAQQRTVRALVEPGASESSLKNLAGLDVETREVDVLDQRALRVAFEGAQTVFHLAAIYAVWSPNPSRIFEVNTEGTVNVILAARDAGVQKIVHTSSIAAVGLAPDGQLADESTPFNTFEIANPYILSKHLSERVALRFAEAGAPVCVVNPAFPFGHGDRGPTPTGQIVINLIEGKVPGYGPGGFCAIDVDDVAAGHLAAETRGRDGERYLLGNHNITFRSFFELVAKEAGVRAPAIPIPASVGLAVARGMEWWSDNVSHEPPLATHKSAAYALRTSYFDNAKARRELDLPCTPLDETVRRTIAFFRDNGMVT